VNISGCFRDVLAAAGGQRRDGFLRPCAPPLSWEEKQLLGQVEPDGMASGRRCCSASTAAEQGRWPR
jgi:hypothetical protein